MTPPKVGRGGGRAYLGLTLPPFACPAPPRPHRRHTLSRRRIIPLPQWKANPETDPEALFQKDQLVLALYPQTTCFYRALIHGPPTRVGTPHPRDCLLGWPEEPWQNGRPVGTKEPCWSHPKKQSKELSQDGYPGSPWWPCWTPRHRAKIAAVLACGSHVRPTQSVGWRS